MLSIFKIFQKLKNDVPDDGGGFVIASLPKVKNHKIGVSENGLPLFFINCENVTTERSLDYNLESISIQFNQKCQLLSNNKKVADGTYTVIALKTDSLDLQEYFLNILYFVIRRFPDVIKLKELKIEIEKLVNLFNKFSKVPTKTIQGLWAELLVIEQSGDPEYLVKSWHYSSTDKFDFNDGIDKVEVKSTSKSRRIHKFSIEQLHPNKKSSLIIASLFVVETGKGKTIFDLAKSINDRVRDNKVFFIINEVISETMGQELEKAFGHYFDYQLAVDSLAFFESSAIPKIENSSIKQEISNIHFDCDLSNVEKINKTAIKSVLHKSLINF